MARKRRNSSSSESEDLPSPKRARPFSIDDFDLDFEPTGTEAPKLSSTYGQRGAFPGLSDEDGGDELFYGPADNGIEYLRMVRSEAKGVPHILVGPNQAGQSEQTNGYAEEDDGGGGYYEDGAFVAAPAPTSDLAVSKDIPPDAQEAYYNSLATRFKELRLFLQKTPPLAAVEALTSYHPISLLLDSAKARQHWRFLLQSHEPQMAQLACMDMETVLEVVKILKSLLAGTVRSRSQEKIERLGAWIWGILGRCNEAGQLGSEEVSELRELGKRAVGLLVGIRDRSGMAYGNEDEEDEPVIEAAEEINGEHSVTLAIAPATSITPTNSTMYETEAPPDMVSEASQLEKAKAMLREKLSTEDQSQSNGTSAEEGEVGEDNIFEDVEISVDKQIGIVLDMIITIVGNFYGQRDLLEFRDNWDDE